MTTMTATQNQPQAPPERDPRRWLVLAVMSLGTLIVFLDLTVVNTALPAISVDLGASTSDLQWVVDSYVLALAGLLMLAGSIGDRYGRKRWMTAGLLFFAADDGVHGLEPWRSDGTVIGTAPTGEERTIRPVLPGSKASRPKCIIRDLCEFRDKTTELA